MKKERNSYNRTISSLTEHDGVVNHSVYWIKGQALFISLKNRYAINNH